MASTDIVLQWVYPPESTNPDRRTFRINQIVEGSTEPVPMYKFQHPNTGTNTGVTEISRKNAATQRWEHAGQLDWLSDHTANVMFGTERVHMRELRKMKKQSSKSRRFKAGGSEYKWKQAENGKDLFCVSTRGKVVATWSDDQSQLRVTDRGEGILDRVVVTCFLNSWMNGLKLW
ncbi:uncharacterized protein B0H18DRAFT_949756 [Fomitopsis serialis]|uniref:uncharacterized protein n=1 Tax=Fomitopsis serialis TaxID=139415 RepID=UPI0020077687|nr:uncharacterized protein B0H18DRAFT_949756 [Neoantrodia serialis]KAH9938401.1 hypothetical protein B0H18DRAFT_949756 [Neoantrodia serialis]